MTSEREPQGEWVVHAAPPVLGALHFGKPLAALVHGHLLWVFLLARPSPAAAPEVPCKKKPATLSLR